jgi:hypothetical protein
MFNLAKLRVAGSNLVFHTPVGVQVASHEDESGH